MSVRRVRAVLGVLLASLLLVGLTAGAASARGGTGGGGGGGTPTPVPGSTCATAVVTNTGQTVRDFKQPDIKVNVENCGTDAVTVAVTVTETASAWYPVCASPVADPTTLTLAAKQKVSIAFPTFRGPCGYRDNRSFDVIWSTFAFQGHNLVVTPIDVATGLPLATGTWFSWQDCLNCGGV